jgi:hypothetical protein
LSDPLVSHSFTAPPRQTVRASTSSYKIDYVTGIKTFLNPEGHFTEEVDFAYLWSFSSRGSTQSSLKRFSTKKNHILYQRDGKMMIRTI